MKLKFAPEFLVVLILFILVIFISNYGSCCGGPVSANSQSVFSKRFPYEGFENHDEKDEKDKKEGMEQQKDEQNEEPKKQPNMFENITDKFKSLFSKEKQEESFTVMSPSQINDAYKTLDAVGALPAKAECIGKSHGYSKSTGGVCWDEQTEKLLLSRGGQSCGNCVKRE